MHAGSSWRASTSKPSKPRWATLLASCWMFTPDRRAGCCAVCITSCHRVPRARVRVIAGRVFDVVVDVRRSSPNFRRWFGVELDAEKSQQVWIPPGFAHGFLALSETAEVLYKTTSYYAPRAEGSVSWNDPDIGIAWPQMDGAPTLSDRDTQAPRLAEVLTFD